MQKAFCDKCKKELGPVTLGESVSVGARRYKLCVRCSGQVKLLINGCTDNGGPWWRFVQAGDPVDLGDRCQLCWRWAKDHPARHGEVAST